MRGWARDPDARSPSARRGRSRVPGIGCLSDLGRRGRAGLDPLQASGRDLSRPAGLDRTLGTRRAVAGANPGTRRPGWTGALCPRRCRSGGGCPVRRASGQGALRRHPCRDPRRRRDPQQLPDQERTRRVSPRPGAQAPRRHAPGRRAQGRTARCLRALLLGRRGLARAGARRLCLCQSFPRRVRRLARRLACARPATWTLPRDRLADVAGRRHGDRRGGRRADRAAERSAGAGIRVRTPAPGARPGERGSGLGSVLSGPSGQGRRADRASSGESGFQQPAASFQRPASSRQLSG